MSIRQQLRNLLTGTSGTVLTGCILTLLVFDLLWCAQTTFRAMSFPALWSILLLSALLMSAPWILLRRLWIQSVFMIVTDIILIANLMYCRTYFSAIPIGSYGNAGNLSDFIPSVIDSFRTSYLLLPSITLATMYLAGKQKRQSESNIFRTWSVMTLLFMILSISLVAIRGGFNAFYSGLKGACYYSTCTTPVFTLIGDYWYQMQTTTDRISHADSIRVNKWLDEHEIIAPLTALQDTALHLKRDNLVVIFCESLESWPIETEVEGVTLTPYLNSLIADSTTLYAPLTVTQVASGRSIDCQLLFNAGLLPTFNDVYSMSFTGNSYPTLNRALSGANGARSMLLTPDSPTTWNQAIVTRSFGIDTLLSRDSWKLDEMAGNPPKLSDGSFLSQVAERLNNELWPAGTNRFIQILTYSGHNPFRLPEKLRRVSFSNSIPEKLRDYMVCVNYTDASLANIIETIRLRDDYNRTMIVITGDHEGLAGARSELRASPPWDSIVSSGQYTPFIILNSPLAGRINHPVGQADMYPTILQLMGLTDYKWHGVGISMLSQDHPGYAIVSMTEEIAGDTTSVSPAIRTHVSMARYVSDKIIRFMRQEKE